MSDGKNTSVNNLEEANALIEKQVDQIHTLEKKLYKSNKLNKFLSYELDSLKTVIHKFESESTICQSVNSDDRLGIQDKLLNDYKSFIEEIVKETGVGPEDLAAFKSKKETQLQSQISELEKQLAAAIDAKDLLEYQAENRHLQGDYDPRHEQVLHFTNNPFDIKAQKQAEEMSELRQKNENLRLRLKVMEEKQLKNKTMNITTCVNNLLEEHPDPRAEIEELEEQLKKCKLKYDRDFELFQNLSKDLRLFCYDCLGFKVDIKKPGVFHIASSSADDMKDDYLKIIKDDRGIYSISLSNSYALSLEKEIKMYAVKYMSIPTLLAHITMQNFQKEKNIADGSVLKKTQIVIIPSVCRRS